jgi:hypothetical protein
MHGAIFAALEIHGPASARDDVFAQALGVVQESHSDRRVVMADAIQQHLDHPPWTKA